MTTLVSKKQKEPILEKSNSRFTVFPIIHLDLWEFYKKALANFWVAQEIDLTKDVLDWEQKLSDNEKLFIKNILAFFAASDGIVNENLVENFYSEIQIPEARQFYAVQICMEAIHSETYSLLIDTYVKDTDEALDLFKAIENNDGVKLKAGWALKWANSKASFAQRLIAFIIVEGIFFSGSFCAIFWLKSRGLLHGLTQSNELISRDESLHVEFGIKLYSKLLNKLNETQIHNLFVEAVEIEKKFIKESLPIRLIGMNEELMSQYIEYVSDYYLVGLGYSKLFNEKCPFDFMESLSLSGTLKSNFFEVKTSQYRRPGVGIEQKDMQIRMDAEF